MKNKFLTLTVGSFLLISPLAQADKDADNSKINMRDRSSNELTADNQSNSSRDIEITRKIRRKLMQDERISTYGKNIKVITTKGEITLKGPVKSRLERVLVESHAREVAGFKNVKNQLSVKK